jgi:hypothetical protein
VSTPLVSLLAVLAAAPPLVGISWRAPLTAPSVVARADASVRLAVGALGTHALLPEADTRVGIQVATDAGWKCGGGADCVAALGRVLGVQVMLDCGVEQQDGAYLLRVTSVDVESALATNTAFGRLSNAGTSWAQATTRTVTAAFSLGTTLQLHGGATGDWLELDDERVPLTPPVTSVPGVSAATHHLRWSMPGLPPQDLDVPANTAAYHLGVPVSAFATPPPPRPHSPSLWPVLGSTGLLAGGLATLLWALPVALGGVLGAAGSAELLFSLQREPGGRIQASNGQSRADVEARRNQGVWLGLGGAAFLLGALVMGAAGVAASAAGVVATVWSLSRQGEAP